MGGGGGCPPAEKHVLVGSWETPIGKWGGGHLVGAAFEPVF